MDVISPLSLFDYLIVYMIYVKIVMHFKAW